MGTFSKPDRKTDERTIFDYATKTVIHDWEHDHECNTAGALERCSWFLDKTALDKSVSTNEMTFVKIPDFQRGIEWGLDRIEGLLDIEGANVCGVVLILLENYMDDENPKNKVLLLDGLQRLAGVTAILHACMSVKSGILQQKGHQDKLSLIHI